MTSLECYYFITHVSNLSNGCYANDLHFWLQNFRKAGIQCVIIHGMAKSVAYDVGDKVTHKKMRNSWNAVYVDGSWRFIHPYWASQSARGYASGR